MDADQGPVPVDLMAVQAFRRWLRADVIDHHCQPRHHRHASSEPLTRVASFQATINRHPYAVADRLWFRDSLDSKEEKLPF